MMRKLFVSVLLASAVSVGSAYAADLPQRSPAPAPVAAAPIFTWTGFYVGANLGWGWGRGDRVGLTLNGFAVPPNNFGDVAGNGWLGGAQAGYNWQNGNIVFGVEADFQGTGIKKTVFDPAPLRTSASVPWFGTVRGRIGFAADRALFYATGGVAISNVKYNIFAPAAPATLINSSSTRVGWTAGAGVEYAFSHNWSTKLEYLYVNTGAERLTGTVGLNTFGTRETQSFHAVRAGLNYRFGGPAGAVVARY